eukprot:TRINITY_DN1860_c0_g1_i2.p1 TRINITY_DN1860_c0_g1~~TRINITY_DN1860_c0_g1_i2.p1  ORF type:complete len:332 (-),score=38.00 TRINITY_DN1860_c0_g1_i2:154-1149(-)
MNPTLGCPLSHMLTFVSEPSNPSETFTCGVCGKPSYTVNGCWTCYHCKYSVCVNCRRPPYRNFVCPVGHVLTWGNSAAPGSNVTCKNCGGSCNAWGNYWSCPSCVADPFNICVYCKREPYSSATCPYSHPLAWSIEMTGDGSFMCRQCLSRQYASAGRWNCKVCAFDICNSCKIGGSPAVPSQPMPPQPTAPQPPMQRPVMSQPVYAQQAYTAPPPFPASQVAQQVYAPQPQMYGAPQPMYGGTHPSYGAATSGVAVNPGYGGVPQGYAVAPKHKGMRCAKQHPLLLSKTNKGYPDSIYICVCCGGQYSCLVQRWHCEECRYNVCKKCLTP